MLTRWVEGTAHWFCDKCGNSLRMQTIDPFPIKNPCRQNGVDRMEPVVSVGFVTVETLD